MKKMRIFMRLFFLVCAGAVVYPLPAGASPRRIVSLGPALTEGLYLLGAEERLVGCTTYCVRPEAAQHKSRVGTVVEVSVEKIVALKPDLVLSTPLTDRRDLEKLERLGLNVVLFSQAKNFSGICRQFLELGKAVGREDRAREIVAQAKKEVGWVTGKTKGLAVPRVFMEIGAEPLFTVTRDSFVNDFIVLAGGINVAAGVSVGFYSREKVLEQNPEVIIIVDMGVIAEREKRLWREFKSLQAARTGRIHTLDPNKICSPTPLSFAEGLKEVFALIHPDVYEK